MKSLFLRAKLLPLLLSILAFTALAPRLRAQDPCDPTMVLCDNDTIPPIAKISPLSRKSSAPTAINVVVELCDNNSLDALAHVISANGVDVSGQFTETTNVYPSWCPWKYAKFERAVTVGPGSLVYGVSLSDDAGNSVSATSTYEYHVLRVVSTTNLPVRRAAGYTFAEPFWVYNTSGESYTFNMSAVCTNGPTACQVVAPTSRTVAAHDSTQVSISYTAGAAGTRGTVKLTATYSGNANETASASITSIADQPVFGVIVTPRADSVRAGSAITTSQRFVVRSIANVASTFNLAGSCGIGITCIGTLSPVTISPGDSALVSTSYQPGAIGAAGKVQLKATYQPNSAIKDSGSVIVRSVDPRRPWVRTDSLNAGAIIARDLCLNIAAGADGGYECGDLRLAHALPAVTTLNKLRVPTLLYNSQHAEPSPIVVANLTRVAGGQVPDSVIATLRIDTVTVRLAYPGSEWQSEATRSRRIAIAIPARAKGLKTGAYNYQLDVANKFGATSVSDTTRGQVIIVDRSQSAFGDGWWLAGLEQLAAMWPGTGSFAKDTILWVGGDGSAAVYRRDRSITTRAVWRASVLDRPDSLTRDSTGAGVRYTRYLPHGLRVQFDTAGKHVATVDRLQQTTQFRYSSANLVGIDLPPFSGTTPAFSYAFAYTSGLLDSVVAPAIAGHPRATKLGIDPSSRRVTSIRDPDMTTVQLGYTGTNGRVTLRINRKGDSTSYSYDVGGKLQQVRAQTGTNLAGSSTTAPLVTTFRSSETQGLLGAASPNSVDESLVATRLDGPRADVADTTLFWLNRFEQPYRIVDALGRETRIWREQAGLPSLATRVRDAAGRTTTASYDGHGNILTAVDSSTFSDSAATRVYATTRYAWQPKYDMVTLVVPPGRDSVVVQYDTTNGNRLWQKDATGDTSRVTITYDPTYGQPLTMRSTITAATTFGYDGLRNTTSITSPSGRISSTVRNALGQVYKTVTPIDATHSDSTVTWYDVSSQDTLSAHYGPALTAANSGLLMSTAMPAQVTWVKKWFGAEGVVDSIARWSAPDTAHIGTLTTRYRYDHAGRKIAEVAPDGNSEEYVLDPAGNVDTLFKRSHVFTTPGQHSIIAMSYDVLNRLTSRSHGIGWATPLTFSGFTGSFPYYDPSGSGGGEEFAYDRAGNMKSATNATTAVVRLYNPNGSIAEDTLRIADMDGVFRDKHTFVQQYTYDLAGRRKSHATPGLTTNYSYDAAGRLKTIGSPMSGDFTYHYDAEGKQDTLRYPTGVIESRRYDAEGNLAERRLWHGTTIIHDDTLLYDYRGKLIEAFAGEVHAAYAYSGLGALAYIARYNSRTLDRANQEFVSDAIDNRVIARRTNDSTVYRYWNAAAGSPSGRLAWTFTGSTVDSTVYFTDGSPWWNWKEAESGQMDRTVYLYYGNGKLHAVDHRTCQPAGGTCGTSGTGGALSATLNASFEEFWYDALGRRVLVRSRSDYNCTTSECRSTLDHVYWDGNQIVREERVPGATADSLTLDQPFQPHDEVSNRHYGVVDYLPGPGIDQPLVIVRSNWGGVIVPYTTYSGEFDQASVGSCNDFDQPMYGECAAIDWAAKRYDEFGAERTGISSYWRSWAGSLARSGKDQSGLMYRRNRYYDPSTGRFTQEDPIGLAGGLNAYGYANGDPITYSDPFGLWPDLTDAANFAAGFGDAVTLGLTDWVRDRIDANGVVDKSSGVYTAGQVTGYAADAAIGAGGALRAASAAKRIGTALDMAENAVGNQAVQMGSKLEARIAGRLWTRGGSEAIRADRGAGEVVGRITKDGSRVYRFAEMKFTGPNAGKEAANLVRKVLGNAVVNVHLVIP